VPPPAANNGGGTGHPQTGSGIAAPAPEGRPAHCQVAGAALNSCPGNTAPQPDDTQAMSPAEDAAFIEAAVDWLRVDHPSLAAIEAATTALTDYETNRDWMAQAAQHIARRPWCCRTGAADCTYAGPALRMARRVMDAVNAQRKTPA
jgi:hypothetical protein